MHQFQITKLVNLSEYSVNVGGLVVDPSITNATVAMLGGMVLVLGFFGLVTAAPKVVPGRFQSVGELMFGMIDNLTHSIIGHDARKYFPYLFTLFLTILSFNVLGLFLVFTATSQLAVTATLALMTILLVLVVGFAKNGYKMYKLFVPSGVPWPLLFIIVPIEILSFFLRPLTLALRLFGNMMGGHIALKVFAGFVVSLGATAIAGGGAALALLPVAGLSLGGALAITALEFLVAFLQAYVFTMLACIYLNDVVNLGEGH